MNTMITNGWSLGNKSKALTLTNDDGTMIGFNRIYVSYGNTPWARRHEIYDRHVRMRTLRARRAAYTHAYEKVSSGESKRSRMPLERGCTETTPGFMDVHGAKALN